MIQIEKNGISLCEVCALEKANDIKKQQQRKKESNERAKEFVAFIIVSILIQFVI